MRRPNLSGPAVVAVALATFAAVCSTSFGAGEPAAKPSPASPMLAVLAQFTAANVPAKGPAEAEPPARKVVQSPVPPDLPGKGLAQHPMLYAGEGDNTLYLVNGGKIVWSYYTGKGGEIDDVWLLTNGHIVFSRMSYIAEVTPQKEIVWRHGAPQGTEIHTCQPVGLEKVLFVQNGLPPKLMVYDKKTAAVETLHDLPAESLTGQKTVHPQFRRFRMTGNGTYLAPLLRMGKVVEFDKDFKPIWTYEIPTPWTAIRLSNGNTLITDEREKLTREVTPKGETVWEFKPADLPPGLVLVNTQSCARLANGNTVIFSQGGRGKGFQLIEVTPDKKIVWVLQDWKNLGPASAVQFLDEPGIPERPGDSQH